MAHASQGKGMERMAYDLERFKREQKYDYDLALSEIRAGRKRSHWIWYIFPQLKGLGRSDMATFYGIDGMGEAKAYLADDYLRSHLVEINEALFALDEHDPVLIMGHIDAMKLRSSLTLFSQVPDADPIFQKNLDKYFQGQADPITLKMLAEE
jgi:uncharacterized protein (DUF1810 family)